MLSHRVDVCLTLQQTQVLNPCTLLPPNGTSLLTCLISPLIRQVPWGQRTHLQLLGYLPHLLNKWRPLFILLFLLGRYHSIRKRAWHAWRNRTSWRVWGGVKNCPARRLLTSHFLFDMTFPRKWTPPSDPAGRARGCCSWSSDYGKGGRCHCNWGHTVVRITGYFCQTGGRRKQQPMKSWPSENHQQNSSTAGAQGDSLQ